MLEYKNAAPSNYQGYVNGDYGKAAINPDATKENYLSALERQIETL